MLSLIACGFGILCDLKGVDIGGFALGVLLAGAVTGVAAIARARMLPPVSAAAILPLAGSTIGFFAGQGTVLLAVSMTLLLLAVSAGEESASQPSRASGALHTLKLKAQSIRGLVGRVEAALERLGVATLAMAVDHASKDKELTLTAEVSLPAGFELKDLLAALQEIEGVIQFALE